MCCPKGLVRIQHSGLFANRSREAKLAKCRMLLLVEKARQGLKGLQREAEAKEKVKHNCPFCGKGDTRIGELLAEVKEPIERAEQ